MAVNLVELITQYLTPDRIERIAAAFNLDSKITGSAAKVSIPSLLAGLASLALQPSGAQKVVDAVRQHAGALDNFSSAIGSTNQSALADKGVQWLSSLLGGQDQAALVGAVAKFCGLNQGASGSILGLLTPVVLGMIAKQGGSSLKASSLTNLLTAQKDNIAAVLPSGFASLLRGTGLLGALGSVGDTVSAPVDRASKIDTAAARAANDARLRADARAVPGSFNWLYWIIPGLILAALLAWYFASNRSQQIAEPPVKTTTQSLTVGGVDISKEISGGLETLRSSLQGVTDADSAKAALPKLQDAKAQIDKVNSLVGQLSPEQRKIVAGLVNQFMLTLNPLFDKVLAIPGVAELIKPIVDGVRTTLTALSAT
jgi:Bacterial protein of unknown function (DUF937)